MVVPGVKGEAHETMAGMPAEEWQSTEHVDRYLDRADEFPHRLEMALLIGVKPDGWRHR